MDENKQEDIKTNDKKQSKFKIIVKAILVIDVIGLLTFLIIKGISALKVMGGASSNEASTPYVEEPWIGNAKAFQTKMLSIANQELGKQYGMAADTCIDIACITYQEKATPDTYDYSISAYAFRGNYSRLYTITINDVDASSSSDIQNHMMDMSKEQLDDYGYVVSYTNVVQASVKTSNGYFYTSMGPDEKELVTGFYYEDDSYHVYQECEDIDNFNFTGHPEKQMFKNDSLIQNYYRYVLTAKGE